MSKKRDLQVLGIPAGVPAADAAVCRSRLLKAAAELMDAAGLDSLKLHVVTPDAVRTGSGTGGTAPARDGDDLPTEVRAERYQSRPPLYTFERLVVPEPVRADLLSAVALLRLRPKVFDEWGLRQIEPFPRTVLNFHGPSGTGKSLAAHALASHLGVPILLASYGEIESKYHGDGPKNVEALFFAAERDGSLLFIDEADSLLSARVADAQQGSEKAINSLRSQLLICLEKFQGVVVTATNFVEAYDKAFQTRVRHVYFPLPDAASRRQIWANHLPPQLPLDGSVSLDRLAALEGLVGRDIKNAVIDAAVRAALAGKEVLGEADFVDAVERLRKAREEARAAEGRKLTPEQHAAVEARIRASLNGSGNRDGMPG
jgi:SpoVK/Ycf46/Vps4 family AAA+-type ATPase